MNLIHDIPPKKEGSVYRMVVENPRGFAGKYEVHKELGIISLDRMLAAPMPFPFEYGFIPGTWSGEDDDPLDIMCILPVPTFPGCLLEVRVVGIYRMTDTGEEDDKILAVAAGDDTFEHVKDLKDMPEDHLKRIEFFWENYKKLAPGKSTEGRGWGSRKEAETFIENGINCYKDTFSGRDA